MTGPHAIVGSALATAVINVLTAVVIIVALTPEAARIELQKLHDSAPLFRLSPIPAGADWGLLGAAAAVHSHRRVHAALRTDQVMDG